MIIFKKEVGVLNTRITSLQKSIADIESDTTTAGITKRTLFQKTLAKSEEVLASLTATKLPAAQSVYVEALKPLNTKLLLVNPNNDKVLYCYTPSKKSGEFAIIAPPGNYKLIITSDKYAKQTHSFIIPDREPLPVPYTYNVYVK